MIEPRGATGVEYGILGGVLALLSGFAFLHVAPHLADVLARIVQSLRGMKNAG